MPLRMKHNRRSYVLSVVGDSENLISGIAFGKNLWNHAYNSARNYYYAHNGGH